jgi:hypothetical protein
VKHSRRFLHACHRPPVSELQPDTLRSRSLHYFLLTRASALKAIPARLIYLLLVIAYVCDPVLGELDITNHAHAINTHRFPRAHTQQFRGSVFKLSMRHAARRSGTLSLPRWLVISQPYVELNSSIRLIASLPPGCLLLSSCHRA